MKNSRRARVLALAALLGALASGCASGVRPAVVPATDQPVSPPAHLAQSAGTDCRPGDSSMVCCIKKFPLTPMESCGASVVEAAEILNGARVLTEAVQTSEDEAVSGTGVKEEEDDFANNAHLPEWKQRCIKNYYACKQEPDWTGPCHDCLRRCEGQQEWPIAMCGPRRSKTKR